ncbi:MAG: hypothetical protein IJH34_05950 [Romboutsia sp.]|nr:hypothetical protein [Romboutsia sp.]
MANRNRGRVMITDNEKFQKEVKNIVDNKIVSHSLLYWLNHQEKKTRSWFIDLILIYILGKENKLLYTVLYLLFRKEYNEIIDSTKKVTKEAILNLVNKIQSWYKSRREH